MSIQPREDQTQVAADGVTLALRLRGHGPALVLLHGGPGIADYLGDSVLVSWLTPAWRVCTYDQRGCRHSPSDGPHTMEANVADLEAIRRHLGSPSLTLVGHSWGAFLGLAYAARHPLDVARLVLVSPVPPRTGWQRKRQRLLDARHTPEQRAALDRIDEAIAHEPDPAARERLYLERFNTALPSYVAPAHRDKAPRIEWYSRRVNTEMMAELHKAYADRRWKRGLRAFSAPTLVVHGREDIIPWNAVEQLTELLPHAQVVGLENCGHFPWLETPEPFRRALTEFLDI